jgi:hypothetical protein
MRASAVAFSITLALETYHAEIASELAAGFYLTVLVVIASYYVLFAVVGGSLRALAAESMVDDRVPRASPA